MSQGRSRGRNSRSPRRSGGGRSGGKRSPRRDRDRSPSYGRGGGGGGYDDYGGKGGGGGGGYGGGGGGYGGGGPPPQAVYIQGDGPGADRGCDCCCLVLQVIMLIFTALNVLTNTLNAVGLFAFYFDGGLWFIPVVIVLPMFILSILSMYFLGKAVNAGFKGRGLPGGNPERPRQFAEWYYNTLTWWKVQMASFCCVLLFTFSGMALATIALGGVGCGAVDSDVTDDLMDFDTSLMEGPSQGGKYFDMKELIQPIAMFKTLHLGSSDYITSLTSFVQTARQGSSDCTSLFIAAFGIFIAFTIGIMIYYAAILYLFPYLIKQSWMKEDPEMRFARGGGAPPGYGGAPRY